MFAPSLRNNCVFIGRILLAVTVLAFIIATSRAGILTDDSSTLGSGVVTGLGCLDDYLFVNADLEYAYYYQTATALNLNLPNEYIYAYQVINHEPFFSEFPLHEFGVSVIQGTVIDSVSYVGVIGGIAPSSIPGHNLGTSRCNGSFMNRIKLILTIILTSCTLLVHMALHAIMPKSWGEALIMQMTTQIIFSHLVPYRNPPLEF